MTLPEEYEKVVQFFASEVIELVVRHKQDEVHHNNQTIVSIAHDLIDSKNLGEDVKERISNMFKVRS